jgi:tRNA A-37 threonylcarbamoyl transferase component Bud32
VDVHVLLQTFVSTHNDHETMKEAFAEGYSQTFADAGPVLERVTEIKGRARYA